jgi:hypothetical protein
MHMSALSLLAVSPEVSHASQIILDVIGVLGLIVILYLLFLAVLAIPDLFRYIRMKMM